jgi:tetratricopeptide (TPR) repeat protein
VVHVAMTDHRIGLPADSGRLLEPRLEKEDPEIDDVELYGATGPALYKLLPLMRAGRDRDPQIFVRFEQALAAAKPQETEPLFDLANAQADHKQWTALESTCRKILDREPSNALALGWLGLAASNQGHDDEAIAFFRRALSSEPARAGLHVQLALVLHRQGKADDAIAELERATALRPNLVAAWLTLGELQARHDNPARAVFAYRRALAIEPNDTRAYAGLERALIALGDRAGADLIRRHAAAVR